jgi:hypothetical protein
MAFAPNGDLAFVTTSPDAFAKALRQDVALAGARTYRLMLLRHRQKSMEVLEETSDQMLSGPAFSPDGRELCYFRLPLFDRQQFATFTAKRQEKERFHGKASSRATLREMGWEDLALPSVEDSREVPVQVGKGLGSKVSLVVRDAKTGAERSTMALELPIAAFDYGAMLDWTYPCCQPQYSPDGKWVYAAVSGVALGVCPGEKRLRLFAMPALGTALSPDGKTLAVMGGEGVGLVSTDGSLAVYRRVTEGLMPKSIVWLGDRPLAMVPLRGERAHIRLLSLRPDETQTRTVDLTLDRTTNNPLDEIAVAPDGKHIVLARESVVCFYSPEGKLSGKYECRPPEIVLQPAFTPDSKLVAMKLFPQQEAPASAIVFLTPDGKEVSRVAIPGMKKSLPPASQPASHGPKNAPGEAATPTSR